MITIDFETDRIEARPVYPPKPVGVAIKWGDEPGVYYSWGHPSGNNYTLEEATAALQEVWDSDEPILFHHAKFDLAVSYEKMGLPVLPWERVHDTMFLAFLLDPHGKSHGLKDLADKYLDMPPDEQDAVAAWIWDHRKALVAEYGGKITRAKSGPNSAGAWISKAPGDIVEPYAIGDVDRTKGLFDFLYPILVDLGMVRPYNLERQVLPVFMENEVIGIRVDVERLRNDIPIALEEFNYAEDWLRKRLKASGLNFDADGDVAAVLSSQGIIDDGNWTLTDKGARSMSKAVLRPEHFNDKQVAYVLGYRNRLKTCLTMFMEPWLEQAEQTLHGTIHPQWHQTRGENYGTRCMPAGELVQTSRGYIPVENVRVGDSVMSHTGEARKVTELHNNGVKPIVKLTTTTGLTLRTTPNHEYMTHGDWVKVEDLEVEDAVQVTTTAEDWLPIRDWHPYEVSTWGRIKNSETGNILSLQIKNRWGHLKVTLKRNYARVRGEDMKDFAVHRLVGLAFNIGGKGPEVRHLNGHAWDNTVINLRWGTSKENTQDAKQHGTMWPRRMGLSKLTEADVECIRGHPYTGLKGCKFSSQKIADKYGVSSSLIRRVRRGERWQHIKDAPRPNHFFFSRVAYIEYGYEAQTYGLTVEEDHSHVTGGFVTHNTGRPSCAKPNLLNISKNFHDRNDGYEHPDFLDNLMELPMVRRYVLPDEDEIWLHRDYDGQEMRVFAHFENGPLMRAYQADPSLDPHTWVHGMILDLTGTDLERTVVKNLNFLGVYGGGAPAVTKQLHCTLAEAKKYKKFHDKALPGRIGLNTEIKRITGRGDPIRTWGGRLYMPEPPKIYDGKKRTMEWKLINYLCQGSAADITKRALVNYHNHPDRTGRFLVTVYDEANVSCPYHDRHKEMAILRECMEDIELDVQMTTSGKSGWSWGDMEKYADG